MKLPAYPAFAGRGTCRPPEGKKERPYLRYRERAFLFLRYSVNPVRRSSSFQWGGSHWALNPMFCSLQNEPYLLPLLQIVGLSNGVNCNRETKKPNTKRSFLLPPLSLPVSPWLFPFSQPPPLPHNLPILQPLLY